MCDEDESGDTVGRLIYELFVRRRRMQKVLVTGGNIGNHVAEMLAYQGTPVRVLVRSVTPDRRWDELGIEQVAADAGDLASLAPAFDGIGGDVDRERKPAPADALQPWRRGR